jgi:hypothetical protein
MTVLAIPITECMQAGCASHSLFRDVLELEKCLIMPQEILFTHTHTCSEKCLKMPEKRSSSSGPQCSLSVGRSWFKKALLTTGASNYAGRACVCVCVFVCVCVCVCV